MMPFDRDFYCDAHHIFSGHQIPECDRLLVIADHDRVLLGAISSDFAN